MAFYRVQEMEDGNLEFTFVRHATVTQPYKWEVIKEECHRRNLDPYDQLSVYIHSKINKKVRAA